jgi:predicted ATP-dependent endonuclease of OLD family
LNIKRDMKHTYIKRAILKDYLTIKDVDITFNSNINIIIGKNGTGKTNFINYLADSINTSSNVDYNSSVIHFVFENQEFKKHTKISTIINVDSNINEIRNIKFFDNNEEIDGLQQSVALKATKILHGLPKKYFIADISLNDSIKKGGGGYYIFPNFQDSMIAFKIGIDYMRNKMVNNDESYNINSTLEKLSQHLNDYSNIQKVRIGQNFNLDDSQKDEIQFNNLYLEYFVNGQWLLFSQLSDGTKRLFYIISEITFGYRSIVLLEEPELGLHPHQLYTLMQFIKEKSEEFQFIITTHSPMVLNTLDSDELDSIIIAKIDNGATKLEHLSEEQIGKAKAFMQKLDLSDYWIHSDLED